MEMDSSGTLTTTKKAKKNLALYSRFSLAQCYTKSYFFPMFGLKVTPTFTTFTTFWAKHSIMKRQKWLIEKSLFDSTYFVDKSS
jgi:hypothetical protein